MPAQTVIKLRRDTAADWAIADPILAEGELGIELDTNRVKIGDGATEWTGLKYGPVSDELVIRVKNASNSASIPAGHLVQFAGAAGDTVTASPAVTDGSVDFHNLIGITAKAIAAEGFGDVVITGKVSGINTSEYSAGTLLYSDSSIPGRLTDQIQLAPNFKEPVAAVVHSGAGSSGQILVRMLIGSSLNDIHNVEITNPVLNQVLKYDGFNWINGEPDLSAKQDVVSGVTSTEIAYLSNVTSDIQGQLNDKQALVAGVSDTEIGYLDGVTSSIQDQLDSKQAVVANVSDTEIGYLDGVTSGIQNQIDSKLSLSGGTMTGKITLDSDPTQALHAVTKQYADSISEGLHIHAAVVALSDSNVDLTGATPTTVIDGVTLVDGDRVIINGQTLLQENGIYNYVAADSSFTRSSDFDEPGEVAGGDFVFVTGGTLYENTGWVKTSDTVAVIGTDPINFTQFSGAGTVTAGTGIIVSGTQVSVDFDDVAATVHTHLVSDITDLTASASELNVLDGITASTAELNYTDGVTSSIQTQLNGKAPLTQSIEAKTGAYTLQSADNGDMVTCSGTFSITVPGNVFSAGDRVDFINTGSGTITFAGSSLTLNAVDAKFTLNKQWAGATVFFTSATTAVLIGNVA